MFLSIGDLNNSKKFFNKTIELDQNHEAANFKKELLNGKFKGEIQLKITLTIMQRLLKNI